MGSVRYLHKGQACMTMLVPHLKSSQASSINARNFLRLKPSSIRFTRHAQSMPISTIIMFVPQQEAWVVERMGKFNRILQPGLNFLIPIVDRVKYVQSLKQSSINLKQSAMSSDNITVNVDGVLYLQVVDPYKASYVIDDGKTALAELAACILTDEIGKITSNYIIRKKDSLKYAVTEEINKSGNAWGIDCLRFEIRDIKLPQRINEAMQMQVEAERKKRAAILKSEGDIKLPQRINEAIQMQVEAETKKRAAILKSEGVKDAGINVAETQKRTKILASEAKKTEQINKAQGEATYIFGQAEAGAKSVQDLAISILEKKGVNAAYSFINELSIVALDKLDNILTLLSNIHDEPSTTLLSNIHDIPSIADEALTIYNNMISSNSELEKDVTNLSHFEELKKAEYSDEDERPKSTSIQSKSQET